MRRSTLHLVFGIQRLIWKTFKPRTRGVKVMLFNPEGELLLIRNNYGRSDLFVLPGGGIRPFETPLKAAEREVKEEVGLDASELQLRAEYESRAQGKRDRIYLFEGKVCGTPVPDEFEVAEAVFADPCALPATTSPATLKRIDEYVGRCQLDATW